MVNLKINASVSRSNGRSPLIPRSIFIVIIVVIVATISIIGISGFIALELRMAQKSTQILPNTSVTPLTDEQKKQLLEQLSAPVAGSSTTTMTDTQKQELLKQLSVSTPNTKQLTDEEKQKLLQQLSAPSK